MKIRKQTLEKICNCISSRLVIPGGGAASAICGALAAGLVAKVAAFSIDRRNEQPNEIRLKEIRQKAKELVVVFQELAEEDCLAYESFSKDKKAKKRIKKVVEIPLEIARNAVEILELASFLVDQGNQRLISDSRCAFELGTAAFYGALEIIKINLPLLDKGCKFESETREEIDRLLDRVKNLFKA
ncbi:MAG TPA: cyclodeaminase/cyclohydrolase family protein [Candidatus Bathyarchaeia archaeon]|nr:cyclodeaminase/cyclohydrolase family protein [Candidatus Bathyarchaeia archaeon]